MKAFKAFILIQLSEMLGEGRVKKEFFNPIHATALLLYSPESMRNILEAELGHCQTPFRKKTPL